VKRKKKGERTMGFKKVKELKERHKNECGLFWRKSIFGEN